MTTQRRGTRAFGTLAMGTLALVLMCTARAAEAQTPGGSASVTFSKDIAPIFQDKCEMCHRTEGMAPMSLVSYAEVRPWIRSIKRKVESGDMPPWYVDKTVGIQRFANDRSLSPREYDLIVRWVDAGGPQGDPRDMPTAKVWPAEDAWQFTDYFGRPPDLIVRTPDYTMPAVSQDRWWEVRGTPTVPEDRWVAGTETRPAKRSRKVVHHATTHLFQKENPQVRAIQRAVRSGNADPSVLYPSDKPDDPATLVDPGPAGETFSEWAVGKNGELYIEHEAGQFLRKGAQVGWDVHLSASGEETPVMLETAFWFYPKGQLPKYRAMMNAIGNTAARDLDIPPGQVTRFESYTTLPAPAMMLNFQPHMHLRGKAFSMEAIYPDGKTEVLNSVPQYRFNWHINYVYTKDAAPIFPKGTIIKTVAWHDNTAANKSNPDPSQWVTYGQRSVDEMAHANEVFVYISQADYERIAAERKKAATTQQQ
ncbi:MAG: hypothetical protein AB7N65_04205 [Vicinamibacterales bacterium]